MISRCLGKQASHVLLKIMTNSGTKFIWDFTCFNHSVGGSIDVIAVKTLLLLDLLVTVNGHSKFRHIVSHNIMIIVLGGTFPYFFLYFFNPWNVGRASTKNVISTSTSSQYRVVLLIYYILSLPG